MAFGINFTLTAPIQQSVNLGGFEVTDATLDFDRQEIVIAYDRLDDSGTRLDQQRAITLDGQAALDAFAEAQALATSQNETVIRALYYVFTAAVRDSLGVTGTINVA